MPPRVNFCCWRKDFFMRVLALLPRPWASWKCYVCIASFNQLHASNFTWLDRYRLHISDFTWLDLPQLHIQTSPDLMFWFFLSGTFWTKPNFLQLRIEVFRQRYLIAQFCLFYPTPNRLQKAPDIGKLVPELKFILIRWQLVFKVGWVDLTTSSLREGTCGFLNFIFQTFYQLYVE